LAATLKHYANGASSLQTFLQTFARFAHFYFILLQHLFYYTVHVPVALHHSSHLN